MYGDQTGEFVKDALNAKAKNEEMQTMNQQRNKKNYAKLIDTF